MNAAITIDDRSGEPYALPVSGSLRFARWTTLVAALSLLASAVVGLRYGEQGLYQSDDLLLPQMYGQDAVSVIVILPLLGLGVWRAGRGSPRGLIVWAGALVYMAYWYHFLLSGIPFGPMFPVHVTLVGSSLVAAAALLARLDVERFVHRFVARTPARGIAILMVGLGALFASAWLLDVVARLRHGEVLDDVARAVYMADLTVMLPVTVIAGVLLWRHDTWGYVLTGPILVNAALSMLTLCVTSVVVRLSGMDVSNAQILAFWGAALVMGGCVVAYLRSLRV
jgi:hypothetical protein